MSKRDDEPLIHSHVTDALPDDHPRAFDSIDCIRCGVMLHASNNECMQTWIEWGEFALCGSCFAPLLMVDGCLEWSDFAAVCAEDVRRR